MTTNCAATQNRTISRTKKRSVSFCLCIVLFICVLLKFYIPVFFPDDEMFFGGVVSPLLSAVPLVAIGFLCVFKDVRIPYSSLLFFVVIFAFLCITFAINKSGIEHGVGLLSLLSGIYVFHLDPLKTRERGTALALFVLAVILIVGNGAPGVSLEPAGKKFNPNNCGFVLAMLYCVCLTWYFSTRAKKHLGLAVLCFILQFVYISRMALLGEIMFTFFALICCAWRKNSFSHRTVFWTILCFSVFGLIFAYFYSEVIFPAVGYGKITILGKDLFTGRQNIWNFAFDSIRKHFWFGMGGHLNEAQFEAGYSEAIMNAHNQAVGTLAYYGIFVFVLFYTALARLAAQPYKKNAKRRLNRVPVIFLLVVTVISYSEICFLSAYMWLVILFAYGLIFSISISEKNK